MEQKPLQGHDRQERKQLIKQWKMRQKKEECDQELGKITLPDRTVSEHDFLELATCSPAFLKEYYGESLIAPIHGDQYMIMDVLVSHVGVMCMRHGVSDNDARQICRFLKQHTREGLNAELRAGRTFIFIPTNQEPRFISPSLDLRSLQEPRGAHIYPGLLFDIAGLIKTVVSNLNYDEAEKRCM